MKSVIQQIRNAGRVISNQNDTSKLALLGSGTLKTLAISTP